MKGMHAAGGAALLAIAPLATDFSVVTKNFVYDKTGVWAINS
jgi:hypothetical protein